jgi:hypothetical protein
LRQLKREGVLRSIVWVTWEAAEIDPWVAPLADMPDVSLVRVPQPAVQGTGNQRGVVYQIRNLQAALSQVHDDDRSPRTQTASGSWSSTSIFCAARSRISTRSARFHDEKSALGVKMPRPVLAQQGLDSVGGFQPAVLL